MESSPCLSRVHQARLLRGHKPHSCPTRSTEAQILVPGTRVPGTLGLLPAPSCRRWAGPRRQPWRECCGARGMPCAGCARLSGPPLVRPLEPGQIVPSGLLVLQCQASAGPLLAQVAPVQVIHGGLFGSRGRPRASPTHHAFSQGPLVGSRTAQVHHGSGTPPSRLLLLPEGFGNSRKKQGFWKQQDRSLWQPRAPLVPRASSEVVAVSQPVPGGGKRKIQGGSRIRPLQ